MTDRGTTRLTEKGDYKKARDEFTKGAADQGRYSLDPASKCGMTGCRVGVRDDSAGPPGNWEGIKKEPEGCLLLTSFRLIF